MSKKNSPTPNAEIELTIDSLSFGGGRGVGRHEGVVVFVPFTAPGDRVRARVTETHKRFLVAELAQILEPSAQRRPPPCPVFGRCGGCQWQHVTYDEQVRQKEKILSDSLRRLSSFVTRPFLRAPNEFEYRNRVQLHVRGERFGFYGAKSRELVETDYCWISEPEINRALRELSSEDLRGTERIELALTEDGALVKNIGPRDPRTALFAQVNRAQNEVLKAHVIEAVPQDARRILDLYCGAGNLTLPLKQNFGTAQVIGVELSNEAIARARAQNPSIEWHAGDVANVLRHTEPQAGTTVVLDPPRIGLDAAVVENLKRMNAETLLYVSCDPQTFARDAERLSTHYRLEWVRGLDMFPQTAHVELIARFVRG